MLKDRFGFVCLAAVLIAAGALTAPVRAADPAVTFSSHSYTTVGAPSTVGYEFDVVSPVAVVGLSTIDPGGDGLNASHFVGLWRPDGLLIASTTVLAGTASPLDSSGVYRYEPIAPLVLPIGEGYIVGSFNTGTQDGIDFYGGPTMAAGLTFVSGMADLGPIPARPDTQIAWTAGTFLVGVVPEPGSLALLSLGGLMTLRRRRTRANRVK